MPREKLTPPRRCVQHDTIKRLGIELHEVVIERPVLGVGGNGLDGGDVAEPLRARQLAPLSPIPAARVRPVGATATPPPKLIRELTTARLQTCTD